MGSLGRSGLLALVLGALGCGEDEVRLAPKGDAGPIGPDAFDFAGSFDQPADFDRVGCVQGSLAGLAPAGVWHLDVSIDNFGSYPLPLRIDAADSGLLALINGREAADVRLTANDLFIRAVWSGWRGEQSAALDACALAMDGSLSGKVAGCFAGEGCYEGTFRAVKVVRRAGEEESDGLVKVGEWAGDPTAPWEEAITVNVRVKDGIAYLARYEDGLRIVDVTNPEKIRDLGWSPIVQPERGEIYNDVKIVDDPAARRHVLMASDVRGVVAIDVSNPSTPVEVATFPSSPEAESRVNVHTLFTETIDGKTLAYLANVNTSGLDVFEVTDPAAPVALGSYVHPEAASNYNAYLHDLYVENGRVYLDYWDLGLVVVDTLADPANPTLVGQYRDYERRTNHSSWVTTTSSGRKVAVSGDEDFTAHVHIVDVDKSSPMFMQRIGEFQLRPEVSVHNIMAFGDRAYIAYYQDGVRILGLHDPTAPAQVAYFNTWNAEPGTSFYEGAIGLDVDLDAGLLFVADTKRGLIILREE